MKNTYFGKGGERLEFTRSLSHGYKKAVFDESLSIGAVIETVTDNDTLVYRKTDGEYEFGKDKLTFVCKSFGVTKDTPAKVSVIFCDNKDMIVTLHEGAIICMVNDKMVQPMVGNVEVCSPVANEVLLVDQDMLLSMKNYFGDEYHNKYWQDFEYFFTVKGGIDKAGCESFNLKKHSEEYVDLSLGYVATMKERQELKEQQREASKIASMFQYNSSADMEFDDIDDSIDDEDFYDDEEDDLGL